MVRFLKENELDKTKHLYEMIFDDTDDFVAYYYKKRVQHNKIIVGENDEGEIISMMHLIPKKVWVDGIEEQTFYIYAVATAPAYRRCGYMSQMFELAVNFLKEQNIKWAYLITENPEYYNRINAETVYTLPKAVYYVPCKYSTCRATKDDVMILADIHNEMAKEYTDKVMLKGTKEYFINLLEQLEVEKGWIEIVHDKGTEVGYRVINGEGKMTVVNEMLMPGYDTVLCDKSDRKLMIISVKTDKKPNVVINDEL